MLCCGVISERRYFAVYGLDLLMDDNLDLWFLEINYSPQLSVVGASHWKDVSDARLTREGGEDDRRRFRVARVELEHRLVVHSSVGPRFRCPSLEVNDGFLQ